MTPLIITTFGGLSKMIPNYYEVLGVKNDASYDDVKRAWREKAKQWHPDKFLSAEEKLKAHEKFIDVMEAYTVLIDVNRRIGYDSRMDGAQPNRPYVGYETASPVYDQKEASDMYREILAETPWEFTKQTFTVLLLLIPGGFFGVMTILLIVMLFGFVKTEPELGFWGVIMLAFMAFVGMVLSMFTMFLLINLYYRAKRVTKWAILRARGQRIFSKTLMKYT